MRSSESAGWGFSGYGEESSETRIKILNKFETNILEISDSHTIVLFRRIRPACVFLRVSVVIILA